MPLDVCHPDTPHKKLRMPEWYISGLMMDRALDAVVRRAKTIDRKHDIPYLAGYSRNGKVIYIDRHMPETMRYSGRDIDTDRYLILHDEDLVKRMLECIDKEGAPPGIDAEQVKRAVARHAPHLLPGATGKRRK